MQPLPKDAHPELAESFATFEHILGFVPNSLLTMQRKPRIVEGFEALTQALIDPAGEVDAGFKRLPAHVASRSAGCQYCQAHSLVAAGLRGVSEERLAALWDYPTSHLYTEAERAALDFALAAGAVPNAVTAEKFARLRRHWTDEEIVEMLAPVCLYAFLNRWNDTMATELEARPREVGERYLGRIGWDGGKHVAD
jgi:uncharacterized peroxidase-related enzyme